MAATISAKDLPEVLRNNVGPWIADQVKESLARAREEFETHTKERGDVLVEALKNATATKENAQKGVSFGCFTRGVALSCKNGFNSDQLQYTLEKVYRNKEVAKAYNDFRSARSGLVTETKTALAESLFIDGGAVVPPAFVAEIIEVLRSKVVTRALGARVVPMPRGNLTMPYGNTGIVAVNVVENANTSTSLPTFGQFTLSAKKIRAVTPVSNDLLTDASPQTDQFIAQDMMAALRLQEDVNFLRGNGEGANMLGLTFLAQNYVHARNASGAAGGSTTTEIIEDLMTMLSLVESNNITIEKGGWVIAPRTKFALESLRDGIGNFYFRQEMMTGRLWGFEFGVTTTQPINLNTTSGSLSSKESEVLFADFDKVIIGDTQELTITPYPGGAYYDPGTSAVVSGISQDQTVVVGQSRSDIAARFRGAEITRLDQVTWGA